MQTRWIGKNVDLDRLTDFIVEFFHVRNFKTSVSTVEGKRLISAAKIEKGSPFVVKVVVNGTPEDFVVDFNAKTKLDSMKFFVPFLSLIGLGWLFQKEVKKLDVYGPLERDFWTFLEMRISELSGKKDF